MLHHSIMSATAVPAASWLGVKWDIAHCISHVAVVLCMCFVQSYAKLAYAPPKALLQLLRQQLMPQMAEVEPPQLAGEIYQLTPITVGRLLGFQSVYGLYSWHGLHVDYVCPPAHQAAFWSCLPTFNLCC